MFTGKEVLLRAIEPKDIEVLYKWENDAEIWNVSGTTSPFSKYTLQQYIETCNNDIYTNKQLRLAIDLKNENHKTIGCIDLFEFDPNNRKAGVGILIGDKGERRKNYATEALKLLIDYSLNILHLHQLYCHVHASNQASVRLFSSVGFKQTGILHEWILNNGEWENVLVMQLFNENDSEE